MKNDFRSLLAQKHTRLWLFTALLVILLAGINILLRHALTAVLILLFSAAVVVIKKPNMVLLIAPVLLLLIFKAQSLNTFGDLREQFTGLMSKPAVFLANFFTPKSGVEVLPPQALQVNEMIEQYGLSDYWLSESLLQEDEREIKERIIEFSWPVRVDPHSPYTFGYPGDFADRADCRVIDTRQDIELGYCD